MRWLLVFMLLASCEQRYRYACQNPENWESKQCQKPMCEVNQECPEHIFAGSKLEAEVKKEVKSDCPK
jgi:hypothetical protein